MNAAFDAGFGVFVVLIVGLAIVAVRWAVCRDRDERARRASLGAGAMDLGGSSARARLANQEAAPTSKPTTNRAPKRPTTSGPTTKATGPRAPSRRAHSRKT